MRDLPEFVLRYVENEPTPLGVAEVFEIVESIDSALAVLHRHAGARTPMDIYLISVFSTLRRSLINRALESDTTHSPFVRQT